MRGPGDGLEELVAHPELEQGVGDQHIAGAAAAVLADASDWHGIEGDLKLYGRALEVSDPERRAPYRAAIGARIDGEPTEPDYHCFAIDVNPAGSVIFGDARYGLAWTPATGLRRCETPG
jgi:hypothetical protein